MKIIFLDKKIRMNFYINIKSILIIKGVHAFPVRRFFTDILENEYIKSEAEKDLYNNLIEQNTLLDAFKFFFKGISENATLNERLSLNLIIDYLTIKDEPDANIIIDCIDTILYGLTQ